MDKELGTRGGGKPTQRHLCSLNASFEQPHKAALSFIDEGLSLGAGCILITQPDSNSRWKAALLDHGVDVDGHVKANELTFHSAWSWFQLDDANFNAMRAARRIWETLEAALKRHSAVRLVLDMAWSRHLKLSAAGLCHWEATYDYLISGDLPVQALCQYNCLEMPADFQLAALRTHPEVCIGSQTVPNPYYEAPRILENEPELDDCCDDPHLLSQMLRNLGAS